VFCLRYSYNSRATFSTDTERLLLLLFVYLLICFLLSVDGNRLLKNNFDWDLRFCVKELWEVHPQTRNSLLDFGDDLEPATEKH